MANYGRGWDDGYGGQSAEAIDAYQDRQEIEAGQIQNAAAKRRREIAACKLTAPSKTARTRFPEAQRSERVVVASLSCLMVILSRGPSQPLGCE